MTILVCKKTGMAIMQFIFDLIWDHSRCTYLAAMPEVEVEQ